MQLSHWLTFLTVLAFVGCGSGGDGLNLVTVSGNVTYEGKPIENGRIQLRLTEGDQRGFAGEIKDGNYSLEAAPGEAEVKITASRIIPGKFDNSNGTPEPVGEMYIPEKYNSKTELTLDIPADGTSDANFELTP